MFEDIKKRCEEIVNELGPNADLLEVARLSYLQALVDAKIIHENPTNFK